MPRRISTDTIVTGAICLLSLLASAYAYANILKLEQPSQILARNLSLGDKNYKILSKGICVGEFKNSLSTQQNFFLVSHGQVNVAYGKERNLAEVNFGAQFNPLGQLIESQFSIRTPFSKLNLTSKSINPINIGVSARTSDRVFEHSLLMPGPVNLVKHGRQYQVEYSHVGANTGSILKTIGTSILGEIDLQVIDSEQSAVSCLPRDRGFFDIASLILKANASGDLINSLVPLSSN